jgi:phosphatidylinositol alpha-mannosyltransferase
VGAVPPAALPSFYRRAHVVCAPATCNESFGIVLLEAMASGRPVVASDISGYRRLLRDGITGMLVPPADVAGWARALAGLLEDRERAALMGVAARRQAEGYGWGAIAARLELMYRELAGLAAPVTDDAGLVAQPA